MVLLGCDIVDVRKQLGASETSEGAQFHGTGDQRAVRARILTGAAHSACRHVRLEAVALGLPTRLVTVLPWCAGASLAGHHPAKYAEHVWNATCRTNFSNATSVDVISARWHQHGATMLIVMSVRCARNLVHVGFVVD